MIACRRVIARLDLLPRTRTMGTPTTAYCGYTCYHLLWLYVLPLATATPGAQAVSWLSPSHYHQARLDVLFVEEAGQLPLAHLIGAAILTMALLTMAVRVVRSLTMAVLTMAVLTMKCGPTHYVRAPPG